MKIENLFCVKLFCVIIFCAIQSNAQQGFGTSNPASSAVIDMVASNKGVLFPRVALTSTTDALTIPSPIPNSLTVFNTATVGLTPTNVYPGYYYWSSALNSWIRINDSLNANPLNWSLKGNMPVAGDFFGTTSNFNIPVKINNNLQYTIKEFGIDFNPLATSFDAVKPWYQLRMFDVATNNENGMYMYKDGSSQLSSYEGTTGTINNFFTTIPGTTLGFPSGAYIQASNGATTQASIIATQFDKITVSNNVPVSFKGIEYAADYSANYSNLSLITKQDLTNGLNLFDATNDAFSNNTTNNRVELKTKADGVSTRAVGEQFAILDNGRVGIGTNSPTATLELLSNITNSARITNYGNPNDIYLRRAQGAIGGTAAANNISGDGTILGRIIGSGFFSSFRDAASITIETDGPASATDLAGRMLFNTTPLAATVPLERMRISREGYVGIGTGAVSTATALLNIGAGTASNAPIKLTSGISLATAQAGAVEYDGTNFFVTNSTNARYTLAKTLTNTAVLDFASTVAQSSTDLTITVTGAIDGDVVSIGVPNAAINANSSYSAWVSAVNTVKIRFNNYSTGTIDPASATFRVSIIKY